MPHFLNGRLDHASLNSLDAPHSPGDLQRTPPPQRPEPALSGGAAQGPPRLRFLRPLGAVRKPSCESAAKGWAEQHPASLGQGHRITVGSAPQVLIGLVVDRLREELRAAVSWCYN